MNNGDANAEKVRAMKTARVQVEFIATNIHYLQRVDTTGKHERSFREFKRLVECGTLLTPNQLNYLDGIYEKVMAGAGLPSVPIHHDNNKRK